MDSSSLKLQFKNNRRNPLNQQAQKTNLSKNGDFEGRKRYGIVIDGGSTGTRIHIFSYDVFKDDVGGVSRKRKRGVLDFSGSELESLKVNPGLSAFAREPEKAGKALRELVEFGKGKVPREYWGETEVRLMATAGMRLLAKVEQENILDVCRGVLRSSGFKFQDDWVSVISGSDEGVYAWVVSNYALGTLGGDPQQTTGIIELGGASMQVTFLSNEDMPAQYSRKISYGNFTYNLYSHSLLQYGQNVAFDLLRESYISGTGDEGDTMSSISATTRPQMGKLVNPCIPRGYAPNEESLKLSPSTLSGQSRYLSSVLPSGNFSGCRSASLALLQKDKEKCLHQSCHIGSNYMPKLQGNLLATENFFHTSKFFGLPPKSFLSNLIIAGQQFCEEDWGNLKKKYHSLDEEDLLHYCFSSAYIVALLHDSLGISLDDDRIGYANQVQDIPLDWALGAFIMQSAAEIEFEHSRLLGSAVDGNITSLLVFFGISLIILFAGWTVSKWKKAQQKTIYDLEKGKYIVRRIRRSS
ncbi:nucleotide phosphatase [Lithospermum erythrorhizon]|uniref:Nucleotide phosphatase n=1 Tax=Lithospermum erythrorhizon TaxID=34254 RepID=A0AAV3RXQ1_LITER